MCVADPHADHSGRGADQLSPLAGTRAPSIPTGEVDREGANVRRRVGVARFRHYVAIWSVAATPGKSYVSHVPNSIPMSSPASPASPVRHFAINADDLPRAKRFYTHVFAWRFQSWGPPGFFMIETGSADTPAISGSLQGRRALVDGERMNGYECTIAVPDIHATERAIIEAGGTILMPVTTIPTVGHLLWFRDTEGNIAGAMQPDTKPLPEEKL
jgi:uncharacterized protein